MDPLSLTGAVTALANALACGLTAEEITLLAGIFVQIGDTLATIAALESLSSQGDATCDGENK